LLARALQKNPAVDLRAAERSFVPFQFDEAKWHAAAPESNAFMPQPPGLLARLMPGSTGRHVRRMELATRRFEEAGRRHGDHLASREVAFEAFKRVEAARKAEVEEYNAPIREALRALHAAEHEGVTKYFKMVFERSLDGEPDAVSAEVGYSTESKHLVVDLELPEFSAVPEEASFRYVKARDIIEAVPRPLVKSKALYSHLLSQVALKCIDVVFRASPVGVVDCLTLNACSTQLIPPPANRSGSVFFPSG